MDPRGPSAGLGSRCVLAAAIPVGHSWRVGGRVSGPFRMPQSVACKAAVEFLESSELARGSGPTEALTWGVVSGPRSCWGSLLWVILGKCDRERGYIVVASDAVDALAEKDSEAAAWWRKNTPHLLARGRCFLFAKDACEIVAENE